MNDCPFCTTPKETTREIIARNEHCYLLANPEGSLQHGMLIIPYRHVETPFDLSAEEWEAIQPLMREAHERLFRYMPDGFNLGWNVGRTGGQEVSHVHLHVFARFADEPFAGMGIRRWFKSVENRRPEDRGARVRGTCTLPIRGDRVVLRDFIDADIPVFEQWNMPGQTWQELDGPYYSKPSVADVEAMGEKLRGQIADDEWPHPRMRLVIADGVTNDLLGVVTSYWESKETNWLSIGIVIFDERYWKGGIGTEALSLWMDYLFAARPDIVRLDLRTWSGNAGMMGLARKLGFREEARFRDARIVNDQYFDGLAFGILRSEWER